MSMMKHQRPVRVMILPIQRTTEHSAMTTVVFIIKKMITSILTTSVTMLIQILAIKLPLILDRRGVNVIKEQLNYVKRHAVMHTNPPVLSTCVAQE